MYIKDIGLHILDNSITRAKTMGILLEIFQHHEM